VVWPAGALASAAGFQSANGITISGDKTTVFVSDPPTKQIRILARDAASGQLTDNGEVIDLPFCADNVEYDDETNEILIGTVPDLMAALAYGEGLDDVLVPGGLAVARQERRGGGALQWVVDDVLNHDGSKLSQVSSGARFGSRVVLGSPYSQGVLVCGV